MGHSTGWKNLTLTIAVALAANLFGQNAEAKKPIRVVTTTIPAPVSSTPKISILGSSVSKNPLVAGEIQTSRITLSSATNMSNLIVDIRIFNSENTMIARKPFENVNIAAGSSVNLQFDYPSASTLSVGTYNIQVGVWDTSWHTYLYETRESFPVVTGAASPTITTTTTTLPPPPSSPATITYQAPVTTTVGNFTISGAIAKTSMVAGSIQYGKITVKSAVAMSGLIVSMRYLDPNGVQLMERAMPVGDFYAGQTRELAYEYAIKVDQPAGAYSIGIGIFGPNYNPTYVYQRNFPSFQVASSGYVPPTPTALMPTNTLKMITAVDAFVYAGAYFVQNNMWGSSAYPVGTSYSSSAGVGPLTSTGSVSARWMWSYPNIEEVNHKQEVKGYPAIGFGQKPGQASTPGSNLPKKVDLITSAISSWDVQSKYTGVGQLAYDLWLTRDGNRYPCFPCTPITHEIMIASDNFGNYATSNPAWYFGSTVIEGVTYRVWKADNFGGGGATWRFIVLTPVNPIHQLKGSIDFKLIFNYLKSVGLITGQEYLSSIEFGNEMIHGTGDVLIKDFKAEVK